MVLYTAQYLPFSVGAALFSLSAPVLLRSLVVMTYHFLKSEWPFRSGRGESHYWRVAGFLSLATFFFVCHHIVAIMFINPKLTDIVHGRVHIVLYSLVVMSVFPVVVTSLWGIIRVKFSEKQSSFSASPLLVRSSPISRNTSEVMTMESDPKRSTKKNYPHQMKRNHKVCSYLLFIVIFAIVISATKPNLYISNKHCPVGRISNKDNHSYFNGSTSNFVFRVISWNVLLGHTLYGRSNLDAIVALADKYEPHVLALQEASGHPPYWGGKDIFGYVKAKSSSCRRISKVVNPLKGSLEVGMLSTLPINSSTARTLSNLEVKNLPTYTMATASFSIPLECNEEESGCDRDYNISQRLLHVYTIHAVYKNWTCSRESHDLSCEQMKFIHDRIRQLPKDDPVIVMGDFNINPSEPELDIWFHSDLGFKSALWPERTSESPPSRTRA